MRFRKTCAAISTPRLVPQPNCVPWKSIRRRSVSKELNYFEHIRRRVFPTAIGRIPPSFFRRPISLAPKKKDLKSTGTLPSKTMFNTLVSFWRNSFPTDTLPFAIRSLYSWGTSRLGPPYLFSYFFLKLFFYRISWIFVINQVPCVSSCWEKAHTRGLQRQ